VRLYPPVWFLLFAGAAWILAWLWPLRFSLPSALMPLVYLLAAAGGVLAVWSAWLFRHHNTTAHPYEEASRLVTQGPYRISRNPMYLGLLLCLVAWGLWLQSLSALSLAPAFVAVITRCNICPEERRLKATFGEVYASYQMQTRRWL
jgi:protein-S-isoprenylcysteine O-methyltransferase Ste14